MSFVSEVLPAPGLPGRFTFRGVLLSAAKDIDDLVKANGAMAFGFNSTYGDLYFGWVAGLDLIDMLRLTSDPVKLAKMILANHEPAGGQSGALCVHSPAFDGYVAHHIAGNPGVTKTLDETIAASSQLTFYLFSLHNNLVQGSGASMSRTGGETYFTGTTDGRSIHSAGSSLLPTGVLGAGQIRVRGDLNWLGRIDQFYAGVLSGTPSDMKGKLEGCIPHAKRRAVAFLSKMGFNLNDSLDVYAPLAIMSSGVRIIAPNARVKKSEHPGNKKFIYGHGLWGCRTYCQVQGGRTMTHPITAFQSDVVGHDLFSNSLPTDLTIGDSLAAANSVIAGFQPITALDGIPIDYFIGGLSSKSTDPSKITVGESAVTSAGFWETYRKGINCDESGTIPPRGTDQNGAPNTDSAYSVVLRADYAKASEFGAQLGKIGSTSWDHGRRGLGLLVAICDAAMQPTKARIDELIPFMTPADYVSLFSGTEKATANTVSSGLIFVDDKEGCIHKLAG